MDRPTRVGLVTWAMQRGGVETFLLRLAQYLAREGFEVEFVTTRERGEWYHRIAEMGLRADAVSHADSANGLVHAWRVGRRLAAGDYDVILLHHALYAQAALSMLPDDVVVIPVLHNDVEPVYCVGCANERAWNVAVGVGDRICRVARARLRHRPLVHIPYGVEMPSQADRRRRAPLSCPVRLAYVGRLFHEQKGIFYLPEIIQALGRRGVDVTLDIAGEGPDAAALQQKVASSGLEDRVRFLGGVPHERVYGLLLRSHILLMPSFYEGLPITALEAQACGCVPVASRLEGITDGAIVHGETGLLVPVGDVDAFAGAVATLAQEPATWQAMSQAAQERVAARFSVEAMGARYVDLIRDALAGRYPLQARRRGLVGLDWDLIPWRQGLRARLHRLVPFIKRT